jgi:uncharacterized integral membrane protein (TIGR00697 family)
MLIKSKSLPSGLLTCIMLYMSFMILCYIFSNKEMIYPFHIISNPGILMLPLALVTMDLIAEVYGYRIARKVFLLSLVVLALFSLAVALLADIPDPNNVAGSIAPNNYRNVFEIVPRVYLGFLVGLLVGISVNTKLLCKWKFLLNGKYFGLRCIAAFAIGDAICMLLATIANSAGRFPMYYIIKFFIANYTVELIALIILAPLANIISHYLKENIENGVGFNPFKN